MLFVFFFFHFGTIAVLLANHRLHLIFPSSIFLVKLFREPNDKQNKSVRKFQTDESCVFEKQNHIQSEIREWKCDQCAFWTFCLKNRKIWSKQFIFVISHYLLNKHTHTHTAQIFFHYFPWLFLRHLFIALILAPRKKNQVHFTASMTVSNVLC